MAGDMTLKDSTTESRTIALEIFSHFSVEDQSLNLLNKEFHYPSSLGKSPQRHPKRMQPY